MLGMPPCPLGDAQLDDALSRSSRGHPLGDLEAVLQYDLSQRDPPGRILNLFLDRIRAASAAQNDGISLMLHVEFPRRR